MIRGGACGDGCGVGWGGVGGVGEGGGRGWCLWRQGVVCPREKESRERKCVF
ncbi:hypothetical protein HanPSC8_Chr13g0547521 [Helianthus annuus]|nr:hypothetical protein HanPSC8_Chr13g0547521 [Helianthus annuus]